MKFNINNRYQAFTAHFFISLFILTLFTYLTIYWWYPTPYFELEGGWGVLKLLFIVGIILGPFLTLVVFKKGKPGLYFDLSFITCIQIIALTYGGNIIYHQKPGYVVFAIDRFTLVSAQDIDMTLLMGTVFLNNDTRGPISVFTSLPEDINKQNDLLFGAFEGRNDLEYRTEYYEPFSPNIKEAILRSKEISRYFISDKKKKIIHQFLDINKLNLNDLSFFPVIGKKKDMLMAVHSVTGEIKGAIDIDPWIND